MAVGPDGTLYVGPDSGTVVLIDRPSPPRASGRSSPSRAFPLQGIRCCTRYQVAPNPLPEAYADSATRARKEWFKRMALRLSVDRRDVEKAAEKYFPTPSGQPAIACAFVGADGSLWVQRSALGGDRAEWLVLSWSGELVGRVRLPADIMLMAGDERRVWGVWRDELDVPYVIGYRIER